VAETLPESVDTEVEPRGALTVHPRAVEHIATAAALEQPGVRRHRSTLRRLAGRDLPRADVRVAGDRVRAALDIAVDWGRPLPGTAAGVRNTVTDALTTQSGLRVDGVGVHIAAVTDNGAAKVTAVTDVSARRAPAPVAAAVASRISVVLALLVIGAGVVGVRDALVGAGWLGGAQWLPVAVSAVGGLAPGAWTLPAGVVVMLIGALLILGACLPRRRTAVELAADSAAYITGDGIAAAASAVARDVPGVLAARSTVSTRRIVVTCRTTGDTPDLAAAVSAAVRTELDALRHAPRVVVRIRTESSS